MARERVSQELNGKIRLIIKILGVFSGQLGVGQVSVTCAGLPVVTDAVDDVVRHFGVLRHGQDVVAGDGGGVPHQEHTVSLALEERNRFLAAQPPPVPASSVFGIKITSHGGDTKSRARLEAFPLRLFLSATHTKTLVGLTAAAEKETNQHPLFWQLHGQLQGLEVDGTSVGLRKVNSHRLER